MGLARRTSVAQGGGDKYGNILVQPTVGVVQASGFSSPAAGEMATAGFYHVTLTRGPIDVDITAARRTALYRFTYPAAGKRNLLLDVSHVLSAFAENGEGQTVLHSHVHVLSPSEISGSSEVTGGWNQQTTSYTVFFCAVSDTPASSWGSWHGVDVYPGTDEQVGVTSEHVGAWLTLRDLGTRTVLLKIGISFVSEAQAPRECRLRDHTL